MFGWAVSGVDPSVPSNGGPECIKFLSPMRKVTDTLLAFMFASMLIVWSYKHLTVPGCVTHVRKDRTGLRVLLVIMSLIFGIEIGFKFATRTMIYILNPCHVTTAVQIYLLAATPSKKVTYIFRIHLNFLNGAVLAFLFPVTESRILPFEAATYWIQHCMMMVVPYYLLRLGGVYNIEKLSDYSWSSLSYGLNLIYHFGVLQAFAVKTEVNLNHIMCPIALDPFYGPYYRIATMVHQAILCPLVCKTYCIVSAFFITKFGPTKVKHCLDSPLPFEGSLTQQHMSNMSTQLTQNWNSLDVRHDDCGSLQTDKSE